MSEDVGSELSFEIVRLTDLDFAQDVVVLPETSESIGRAAETARFLDQNQRPEILIIDSHYRCHH